MDNRIKHFRIEKKMSQRDLAQLVGVSQQQIQRFEVGISPVRLTIAAKISDALKMPLEKVFPAVKSALNKLPNRRLDNEKAKDALANAGIEIDSVNWTIEIGFSGGPTHQYRLSSLSARRMEESLFNSESEFDVPDRIPFHRFDSEHYSILLNFNEVSYVRFKFDAQRVVDDRAESLERAIAHAPSIEVWIAGEQSPLEFEAPPDYPEKEGPSDPEDETRGQLEMLLINLWSNEWSNGFLSFMDIDGENVHLHAAKIALIAVPQWLLKPEMLDELVSEES